MAEDDEVFDLTWREFSDHLVNFSSSLLDDPSLMDISLQCEGGTTIRAHRLILAACSPWFRKVILALPITAGLQPVVALWDCEERVMKSILAFMYNGKVQVHQDDLAMFLKMAERLEVKGLVEKNSDMAKNAESEPVDKSVNQEKLESKMLEEVECLTKEIKDVKSLNFSSKMKSEAKSTSKLVSEQAVLDAEIAELVDNKVDELYVRDTFVPDHELKQHELNVKSQEISESSEESEIDQRRKMKEMRIQALKEAMTPSKEKREKVKNTNLSPSESESPEEIERIKKMKMRALRMRALKEAMDLQLRAKSTSPREATDGTQQESLDSFDMSGRTSKEDFNASMKVQTEMSREYEKQPTESFRPTTPDGRIFCNLCNGGPMQRKYLSTHMRRKHSGDWRRQVV